MSCIRVPRSESHTRCLFQLSSMGLKRQMLLAHILLSLKRSIVKRVFDQKMLRMAKFKIMSHNQKLMAWMGIHSYRLTEPTNEFFDSWATFYILCSLTVCVVSTSAYAYKISSQIGATIDLCYLIIASFQACGMYITIGFHMKKVKVLHLELQAIVDEGDVHFKY